MAGALDAPKTAREALAAWLDYLTHERRAAPRRNLSVGQWPRPAISRCARAPADVTADDLIVASTRQVTRSSRPEPFILLD